MRSHAMRLETMSRGNDVVTIATTGTKFRCFNEQCRWACRSMRHSTARSGHFQTPSKEIGKGYKATGPRACRLLLVTYDAKSIAPELKHRREAGQLGRLAFMRNPRTVSMFSSRVHTLTSTSSSPLPPATEVATAKCRTPNLPVPWVPFRPMQCRGVS